MLNKYGERTQPCRTPFLTGNHSDSVPATLTLVSCFLYKRRYQCIYQDLKQRTTRCSQCQPSVVVVEAHDVDDWWWTRVARSSSDSTGVCWSAPKLQHHSCMPRCMFERPVTSAVKRNHISVYHLQMYGSADQDSVYSNNRIGPRTNRCSTPQKIVAISCAKVSSMSVDRRYRKSFE